MEDKTLNWMYNPGIVAGLELVIRPLPRSNAYKLPIPPIQSTRMNTFEKPTADENAFGFYSKLNSLCTTYEESIPSSSIRDMLEFYDRLWPRFPLVGGLRRLQWSFVGPCHVIFSVTHHKRCIKTESPQFCNMKRLSPTPIWFNVQTTWIGLVQKSTYQVLNASAE